MYRTLRLDLLHEAAKKYDHITPIILQQLHWFPVSQCFIFKLFLITYKALNGLAPAYIKDLLKPCVPTRTLWSSSWNLLEVPSVNFVSYLWAKVFLFCSTSSVELTSRVHVYSRKCLIIRRECKTNINTYMYLVKHTYGD